MSENIESRHLDKRVPIALIFAIALHTGGALWWAAGAELCRGG